MNRNGNETESFAGNFVASDEEGLFFEVPYGFLIPDVTGHGVRGQRSKADAPSATSSA
jgi:hypothetical protein